MRINSKQSDHIFIFVFIQRSYPLYSWNLRIVYDDYVYQSPVLRKQGVNTEIQNKSN